MPIIRISSIDKVDSMSAHDYEWLQQHLDQDIQVFALNFTKDTGELSIISVYSDDGIIVIFPAMTNVEFTLVPGPEMTEYKAKCLCCGKVTSVMVPTEQYNIWRSGEALIQDALPMLSTSEREFLMTNICEECWDKL